MTDRSAHHPTDPDARTWRRLAARVALGVALIFAAVLPPVVLTPDESSMLAVSLSVVQGRGVSVPAGLGTRGHDGRFYSNWYPLNSALALPVVTVASAVASAAQLPARYVAAPFVVAWTALLTSLTCGLMVLAASAWGGRRRAAVLMAVAYAFGTIVLLYGRSFFAETLLGLLTLGALLSASGESRRAPAVEAALAGLAVLAKPTGIVVAIALVLFHLARRRWARAVSAAGGAATGLITYFAYNSMRFGDPFTFGQPWGSFRLSVIPEALVGLLASPGRGLLWYSPLVALAVLWLALDCFERPRQPRAASAIALLAFLGFLSIHALWDQWAGGWSWGPRLLVPAFPAVLAAAAASPRFRLRLAVPFAVVGLLVTAPTLITTVSRTIAETNEAGFSPHQQIWSVNAAPITRAWGSAVRQVVDARHADAGAALAGGGVDDSSVAAAQSFRILPIWWSVLPVLHLPVWFGLAIAAVLAATGAFVLGDAMRRRAGGTI